MAPARAPLRQLCRPDPVAFGHWAHRTRRWQLGTGVLVRVLGTRGYRRDLALRWLARLARPEMKEYNYAVYGIFPADVRYSPACPPLCLQGYTPRCCHS